MDQNQPPPAPAPSAALVAECARKSAVSWLSWADEPDRLVWHAWYDDRVAPALVVLDGDSGQDLPGLARAGRAVLTLRSKDTGARLVVCPARVEVVAPDSEAWRPHVAALLAARLNLAEPATAPDDWARRCTVLRVVPVVPSPA